MGGMTSIGSPCDLMDSAVDTVDPCDMLENLSEPCDMVRIVSPELVDICENPDELEVDGKRGGRIALYWVCAIAGCCTCGMCWSSSGIGSGRASICWSLSLSDLTVSWGSLCRLDGKRARAFLKRPEMDGWEGVGLEDEDGCGGAVFEVEEVEEGVGEGKDEGRKRAGAIMGLSLGGKGGASVGEWTGVWSGESAGN